MSGRASLRLQAPASIDATFPIVRIRRRTWFRAHRERQGPDGGCWYFASVPRADDGSGGRFDVPEPDGTCYFAASPLAAARERLARGGDVVFVHEVVGVVVSTVQIVPRRVADLLSVRAAPHGVTGELSATADYRVSQRWATALCARDFGAIRYQPRFSTDRVDALAVFGSAGAQPSRARVQRVSMREVLAAEGYRVVDVPSSTTPGVELLD